MKYSNDCSDACTHVLNDLFITSFVRNFTPGHSTSNIFTLLEEATGEEVGDAGSEDELGSPGKSCTWGMYEIDCGSVSQKKAV